MEGIYEKIDSFKLPKELSIFKNEVFQANSKIIDSPKGIYFLYDDDELVYIGQSVCVLRRLFDHLAEQNIHLKKKFNKMFFIRTDESDELRRKTEANLIRFYKPKYNIKTKTTPTLKEIFDLGILKDFN